MDKDYHAVDLKRKETKMRQVRKEMARRVGLLKGLAQNYRKPEEVEGGKGGLCLD